MKSIIFSIITILTINLTFSQGPPGAGVTNDIRLAKAAQKKAKAQKKKKREISKARKKELELIEELKRRQDVFSSNPSLSNLDCSIMTKVTVKTYSDNSTSYTITRSDGSTQNIFTHSEGPPSYGTAGTASHREFSREATQAKEANGVSQTGSRTINFQNKR